MEMRNGLAEVALLIACTDKLFVRYCKVGSVYMYLVISLRCMRGVHFLVTSLFQFQILFFSFLFFYGSCGKELVHGFLKLYPNTHTLKQKVKHPATEK